MLLDVCWNVIFFSRDIFTSVDVLPDIEVGNKQIARFLGSSIKLYPLWKQMCKYSK